MRFAVKPTSSILTPRRTIDRFGNETEISTKGRHDPCVGIRAVPVGEAMMAIVLADHFLRHRAQVGSKPDVMRRSVSRRLAGVPPYSYRADPAVPAFPDDKALVVFDGVCVLCSGFAKFILKRDRAFAFRLTTAQSPLGQALFRHYGLDTEDVRDQSRARRRPRLRQARQRRRCRSAPGRGRGACCALLRLLPRPLADWLYDRVAQQPICLVRPHRPLHDPAARVARPFIE